jgi:lysylphosphatidylglycerol synthetase-like protein (DUF2156 family)
MSHYLKYFAAVYLVLLILVGLLIYALHLGVILLIPALIAAAFLSARHFVRTEQRLPSQEERSTLVWGSTTLAMTFGLLLIFTLMWLHPPSANLFRATSYMGKGPNSLLVAAGITLHGLLFHTAYTAYARYSLNKHSPPNRK